MADQIEMSSAENVKRNAFGPVPSFLGKPTFSFQPNLQKHQMLHGHLLIWKW